MKKAMVIMSLGLSSVAFATSPVMPKVGEELFQKNCTSCHMHDTPELFTRADRKATNRAELSKWVSQCIAQTGVEVFPEEEEEIEEFLNEGYYHYTK